MGKFEKKMSKNRNHKDYKEFFLDRAFHAIIFKSVIFSYIFIELFNFTEPVLFLILFFLSKAYKCNLSFLLTSFFLNIYDIEFLNKMKILKFGSK